MSEIRANGHLFRFWWNHKHLQIFGNCDDHATFSTKTRLTLKKMAIGEKPNVARVKQRNSDTQKNAVAAIEFLKCERTETCIYLLFCCSCCCSSSNFSTVEKGHFTVAYASPCSYYTSAQLIAFHSLCVLPLLVYTIEMIFLIHWHVVNSFTKSSACSCSNMIIREKKRVNKTHKFRIQFSDKADFKVIAWVSAQIAQTLISLDDMAFELKRFCVECFNVQTQLLNRKLFSTKFIMITTMLIQKNLNTKEKTIRGNLDGFVRQLFHVLALDFFFGFTKITNKLKFKSVFTCSLEYLLSTMPQSLTAQIRLARWDQYPFRESEISMCMSVVQLLLIEIITLFDSIERFIASFEKTSHKLCRFFGNWINGSKFCMLLD